MILRGHHWSNELGMETGVSVVAPDDLDARRPRRVAYLLHGLCGRSGDWIDYTMLASYARESGVVVVMPEAARSFYADMAFGLRYFSYVADELPRKCERLFGLSARKEDRAVVGASMGGYGALKIALSYPDRFGLCCAFSPPCLFLSEFLAGREGDARAYLEGILGDRLAADFLAAFGPDLEPDPRNDLLSLAKAPAALAGRPRIRVSCGRQDAFLADNRRFCAAMKDAGHDVDYDEAEGGHDWAFFDRGLKASLEAFGGGPSS